MPDMLSQAKLSSQQVQAFYHEAFVVDQVRDFQDMLGNDDPQLVVDMGGGCGFFAKRLSTTAGYRTRVVDVDLRSIERCRELGVEACLGDALAPTAEGDEDIVCFNLILHHLVGKDEGETRALQMKALRAWHEKNVRIFVHEYIYQSFAGAVSARLIFEITSSIFLSAIAKVFARVIPAFRANTFGVGVRFRSHEQWIELFREAGFMVEDCRIGHDEPIAPPLRILLIKSIRRDSFLLAAA